MARDLLQSSLEAPPDQSGIRFPAMLRNGAGTAGCRIRSHAWDRAMPFQVYQAIADRLEQVKSRGDATEYLVRWVGTEHQLTPRVTIWNEDGPAAPVRAALADLLSGFVAPEHIEILPG